MYSMQASRLKLALAEKDSICWAELPEAGAPTTPLATALSSASTSGMSLENRNPESSSRGCNVVSKGVGKPELEMNLNRESYGAPRCRFSLQGSSLAW